MKEDPFDGDEKALVPKMIHNGTWIINRGFPHDVTCDKNRFIKMNECGGGSVNFRNNSACVVKDKGSIILNNEISCDDVYWVKYLK